MSSPYSGSYVPVPGWGWNEVAQRYIHEGRFVSPTQVRGAIDAFVEGTSDRLKALTLELRSGSLTLGQWQTAMASEIKASHLASAVAANGGWANMTPESFGQVGGLLKEEFKYLNRFASQIAEGAPTANVDSDAILNRVALYGEAPRHTYEEARLTNERDSGFDIEWNELGAADHCDECVDWTEMGEVATGTIPLPGERTCGNKCHCRVRRRRSSDNLEQEAE